MSRGLETGMKGTERNWSTVFMMDPDLGFQTPVLRGLYFISKMTLF